MNSAVDMGNIDSVIGFKNKAERVYLMAELLTRLKEARNLWWFKRMYLNMGICALAFRDTDSHSTRYKIMLLLQLVCFDNWKDHSGDRHFPVYIQKDTETPSTQYYNNFLWNPLSKYGRKRMELLDHSIEVLGDLVEKSGDCQ